MDQNNTAIIATVHYPKVKWLDNLLSSYFKTNPDIDLYITISESEKELFKDYFGFYEEDRFIICPDVEKAVNPITYKKMCAFWDRVSIGGIVVFDEYAYSKWSESKGVDRFFKDKNAQIVSLDYICPTAYVVKR